MKILHTSDWHIGRALYGRKRYEEFDALLNWVLDTIASEQIDVLIIAGDVFDTATPSNRAQQLYYEFLCQVATTCCRHVVIVGGNHDSPTFLDAPKNLLLALNVHVVGGVGVNLDDEVVVLSKGDIPEAIVCAVPYLRDKDIRTVEAGESIDDKNAKLIAGVKAHYAQVCGLAEQKRDDYIKQGVSDLPLIATGHLFTAGGQTIDGDGVRDLYVGSLAHVGNDVFPKSIDYLALGHLHVPQKVGGDETRRYSGSPIPMGFGEVNQQKQVVIVEFSGRHATVKTLAVPCFQVLKRIVGTLDEIGEQLKGLAEQGSDAWIEVEYTGSEIQANLTDWVYEQLEKTKIEVLRIKNRQFTPRLISAQEEGEVLETLDVGEVFDRCLDAFEIPENQRDELSVSYQEIVQQLHEADTRAQ